MSPLLIESMKFVRQNSFQKRFGAARKGQIYSQSTSQLSRVSMETTKKERERELSKKRWKTPNRCVALCCVWAAAVWGSPQSLKGRREGRDVICLSLSVLEFLCEVWFNQYYLLVCLSGVYDLRHTHRAQERERERERVFSCFFVSFWYLWRDRFGRSCE